MTEKSSALAMTGMALATFLGWLDLTIVNTALPAMQASFAVTDTTLQWVMNALLLSLSAFMVILGKLADRYGRRKILYSGLLLIALSSIAAALSQSFISLIIARFVQGIAIGILYTAPIALVSSVWPKQVAKAMGIMIGIGGVALAIGPVLGGVLVSTLSWHAIFWINLPIALAAFLFCVAGQMPESKMVIAEKIDSVGAILIVFMLSILVFTTVNVHTGTVLVTLGSYLAAFILMALFVMRENNISFPIIDFHLFANRAFIVGAAASLFLAVFYCVDLFFIPLHLHHLGYQSSMTIGLMLLPPSLMFAVLSLFSGKISATFGPRNTMLCGYVFFVASAVMQIVLGHSTNLIWLIAAYLLLGAGWALILSTAFGTALASLPAEMGGLGMGSIGTLHNLGGTIGLAVGSTLGYFGAMGFILAASVAAFVVIFVGLAKHGIDL